MNECLAQTFIEIIMMNIIRDQIILVDESDQVLGSMGKQEVHEQGLLHRAFSVFLFNSKGEMLLQQRADEKYHSPGLWTNTCCSHPFYGERLEEAVHRRLMEEMGLRCDVQFVFQFQYRADLDQGMIEHELDHVFLGITDNIPSPDSKEVKSWKYWPLEELVSAVKEHPSLFTVWFRLSIERVIQEYQKHFSSHDLSV